METRIKVFGTLKEARYLFHNTQELSVRSFRIEETIQNDVIGISILLRHAEAIEKKIKRVKSLETLIGINAGEII